MFEFLFSETGTLLLFIALFFLLLGFTLHGASRKANKFIEHFHGLHSILESDIRFVFWNIRSISNSLVAEG